MKDKINIKDLKLTSRERGLLTIIIREVLDALPDVSKVHKTIKGWIDANDLHPELISVQDNCVYYFKIQSSKPKIEWKPKRSVMREFRKPHSSKPKANEND